ncbi:MAG: cyclodeaminase/cyclohydrolase family protein [Thermoleophilia bacterium]
MADPAVVYIDESLRTYIDDAASAKPAPGGGSVSACAGALGAALVGMVCNLTLGREKYAAVEDQMQDLVGRTEAARARLQDLIQEDTTAYNGVLEAYRMPKGTEAEIAARKAAVQAGLVVAANVPLEIGRVALEVCRLSRIAADHGNPNAVTDAGVGVLLAEAAVVGAALNVRINLGSIEDAEYVTKTAAEVETLLTQAATLRADVLAVTNAKI